MSEPASVAHFPWERGLVFVPSLLYALGAALALAGLVLWPTHAGAGLLAGSLGVSEAGAAFARRFAVCTLWGERFEWSLSSCVASAIAWHTLGARGAPAVFGLAAFEALASYHGWRVSGRAAVTIAALTAHFA